MINLKDIQTKNWSLSLDKPGEIVTDLDDINQCIYIILMTVPGTDRMRPTFGCGIHKYLDKPVSSVIPNMVKAIADALEIWETRIEINKISVQVELSTVVITVEWTSNLGQMQSTVIYNNGSGSSGSSNIEYSSEYSEEYN